MKVPPVSHGQMHWHQSDDNNLFQKLENLYHDLQALFSGFPGNVSAIEKKMEEIKQFLSKNRLQIEKICTEQRWTGKEPQNFLHLLCGPDGKMEDGAIFNDINNFMKKPNIGSLDEAIQDVNQLGWYMTHSPKDL